MEELSERSFSNFAGAFSSAVSSHSLIVSLGGRPARYVWWPRFLRGCYFRLPLALQQPALQPAQRSVAWKTVRLGQTPVYATIPGNWQVKEDAPFRFSLSARDEGNVIVRTVINEKSGISTKELLHEGILASRELPRPLAWVKPPVPQELFKQEFAQ